MKSQVQHSVVAQRQAFQLDEIEKMAKRQAQEAQVLSQVLMSPVVALAARLKDPHGARTLEKADMDKLLEMSFETAKAVPRLHKAERPSTDEPRGLDSRVWELKTRFKAWLQAREDRSASCSRPR